MSYVVGPYADIKDPLPVLIQAASSRGRGMLSGSGILKVEQLGKSITYKNQAVMVNLTCLND